MTPTRRDYINQILRVLDLPANTNAGLVGSADNNPATPLVYTNDQTFTDAINDAGAIVAMECIPLYDVGTKASVTTGLIAFTDLVVSSGNRLWAIEGNGVTLGTSRVIRGSRHYVQANSAMGTASNPFYYWHPLAQVGIYITGIPTPSAGTLSVFGFAVPKPLVADTDTFPAQWLKAEDAYTIAVLAAARICEKRAADSILGPRAQELYAKYAARRQMHRDRLTDTERDTMVAADDGATTAAA